MNSKIRNTKPFAMPAVLINDKDDLFWVRKSVPNTFRSAFAPHDSTSTYSVTGTSGGGGGGGEEEVEAHANRSRVFLF